MPLRPDDFRTFFGELYKDEEERPFEPFPWQERLAKRVCEGDWPACIAVPTAGGKTACIDIAVFALAVQASAGERRTAPRRIFFVVDRRVIVDQAFKRAKYLACKLKTADDGVLKQVANQLRSLAGNEGGNPLECFELRGGVYRDNAWVRTPLQPTVVCSTVDQIGSRLLFRGYGISPQVAPIHAAMVGNDSLIVLDEAHCSNPFRQTVESIRRYRDWAEEPLKSPFHFVVMSATPGQGDTAGELVTLDDADRKHVVLKPRLEAMKPTTLVVADKAKGKPALEGLASFIAAKAKTLVRDDVKAVGIIVNRVATATLIYRKLKAAPKEFDYDVGLLTGRMRPYDKDRAFARWKKYIEATPERETPERPLFIVSTQCLEVGADLDFDAMISECASLDALRQRFGRLNRLGLRSSSTGIIVIQEAQEGNSEDDPIYGKQLSETWKWLKTNAVENSIDMGVVAVDELIKQSKLDARTLCSEQPNAPVMLPAYVDFWVQTAPIPRPDPDVSLFLHGSGQEAAEVQVVWRADLDDQKEGQWAETVSLCPPTVQECLPVQLHVLRKWWREPGSTPVDAGDVEGATFQEEDKQEPSPERRIRGLLWRGLEKSRHVDNPRELSPGDTLVLPLSAEGWNTLGHVPESEGDHAVVDIAELVDRRYPVLRVHRSLTPLWRCSPGYQRLCDIARDPTIADPEERRGLVREALRELAAEVDLPDELKTLAGKLAEGRLSVAPYPGEEEQDSWSGMVLSGSKPKSGQGRTFSDEDDTSSAGSQSVPLDEHNHAVGILARFFSQSAGLPSAVCDDIQLAGTLHDLGKADPRFQAWLHGGNRRKAETSGTLLAKSVGMPRTAREYATAREKSGYPRGGRHEFLSVRLAECDGVLPDDRAGREFILHLIGAHHGHCRPFASVIDDPTPMDVTLQHEGNTLSASSATGLERLDSGAADRFWHLVRRYGWWGAAYLEAILRLADWRVSEGVPRKESHTA
ncbi:MAG: type I-U CRISPR-associated helicase/endonuclease Cas3 [Planctomycetia bacterium]|nr:type I-U CRISPR-associated helicase/endonuclease Cas3 [Planctomycetia bacterium]